MKKNTVCVICSKKVLGKEVRGGGYIVALFPTELILQSQAPPWLCGGKWQGRVGGQSD